MTVQGDYLAPMPSDPDLKRLAWRAHHRGTKEADLLVGGFFDAHHRTWDADDRARFAAMLDEQVGFLRAAMVRTPGEALQVRVGGHGGHVIAIARHCERRNKR